MSEATEHRTISVTAPRDRRWLLLVVAAAVIGGLCYWRVTHNPVHQNAVLPAEPAVPAPLFEGYDPKNRLFRLSSFVGRGPILLAFPGPIAGPTAREWLAKLSPPDVEFKRSGGQIVLVTPSLPAETRAATTDEQRSDVRIVADPTGEISARYDVRPGETRFFHLDRGGRIPVERGRFVFGQQIDRVWEREESP